MTTVSTGLGPVRGRPRTATISFLGVPYAAPPVGPLRWKPPRAAAPWNGALDATRTPSRSFQQLPPPMFAMDGRDRGAMSEDMLFLNISTPAADKRRRPVIVYIHGGGFTSGSANDFDSTPFARNCDAVFVSINYRLGIFGYLDLSQFGPEYAGSGSLGFQDQIAALRWVRDNIADYGGDPDNVTVAGVSAGGGSVLALLAAPSAKGLFHKAAAFSPGVFAPRPTPLVDRWAKSMGSTPEAVFARIRDLPAKALFEFGAERGLTSSAGVDGAIVTLQPDVAIRARLNPVPLFVGTCINEGTMLAPWVEDSPFPDLAATLSEVADWISAGRHGRYQAFLSETMSECTERERVIRFWYDSFRAAAVRSAWAAAASGQNAWLYSFEVPTDHPLGPTHASDVKFAFNLFDAEPGEQTALQFHLDTPENRALGSIWSSALARFMRSGDPNGEGFPFWPPYNAATQPSLVLRDRPIVINHYDSEAALATYAVEGVPAY